MLNFLQTTSIPLPSAHILRFPELSIATREGGGHFLHRRVVVELIRCFWRRSIASGVDSAGCVGRRVGSIETTCHFDVILVIRGEIVLLFRSYKSICGKIRVILRKLQPFKAFSKLLSHRVGILSICRGHNCDYSPHKWVFSSLLQLKIACQKVWSELF